jgi:hypothetical protein
MVLNIWREKKNNGDANEFRFSVNMYYQFVQCYSQFMKMTGYKLKVKIKKST